MENEGPPRVSLGSGSEADEKNREHPDKSRNSSYGKTPSPPVDVNKSLIDLTIEDDKIPMRSEGLNEISTSEKEEQERTPKGGENAKNEMNGDGDGTRKTMKRPMEEGEATPSCPTHVSTGIEFKSKRTRTSDTECSNKDEVEKSPTTGSSGSSSGSSSSSGSTSSESGSAGEDEIENGTEPTPTIHGEVNASDDIGNAIIEERSNEHENAADNATWVKDANMNAETDEGEAIEREMGNLEHPGEEHENELGKATWIEDIKLNTETTPRELTPPIIEHDDGNTMSSAVQVDEGNLIYEVLNAFDESTRDGNFMANDEVEELHRILDTEHLKTIERFWWLSKMGPHGHVTPHNELISYVNDLFFDVESEIFSNAERKIEAMKQDILGKLKQIQELSEAIIDHGVLYAERLIEEEKLKPHLEPSSGQDQPDSNSRFPHQGNEPIDIRQPNQTRPYRHQRANRHRHPYPRWNGYSH